MEGRRPGPLVTGEYPQSMQPSYSADAEAYREKVQAFLAEHLPPDWKGIGALEGEAHEHFVDEWRKTLFENGYLATRWPVEYGGGGLSPLEGVIVAEEFAKAGGPTRGGAPGGGRVGR